LQDMGERIIWPGLTYAHMHLQHYALSMQQESCETDTLAECLQRVEKCADNTKKGDWITGWGWNQNSWSGGFGNARDLDHVAPHHPTLLHAKSGHASWANTLALNKAGITSDTPDPEGGVIQRDEAGEATGILFENATELVSSVKPEPSVDEVKEALLEAQSKLWQLGLTGLHDFDGPILFSALQLLNNDARLKLRVLKSIPLRMMPKAIELGLRTGFGNGFLKIGSIKVFSDGALGPQTAAMIEPFENTDGEHGILLMNCEQFFEYGKKAAMNGLSLAVHAIGDLANREVLDGFEKIRSFENEHNLPRLRHRIEHVQLLHPDDQNRLSELGIIASMQPIHTTSDIMIADKFWGERSKGAYIFRTLKENGTRLAFGSDAPVETPNPFVGLHAAVTRRRADGTPGPDGWHPEQRIDLKSALSNFTIGAAFASHSENKLGMLAPGFYADLIVLAYDPFSVPQSELKDFSPEATMVAGEWVWQA
ncbi:MAG: amidohydrolase, partial [Anaerolineaceae bacterium]|nr:amidohydrolase [Anaerolineaceae bacterium]